MWARIAKTTNPLGDTRLKGEGRPESKSPDARNTSPSRFDVPEFRIGDRASVTLPSTALSGSSEPVRMDRKAFQRLKRGRAKPDARIDLHGMTVDRAERALAAFLLRAYGEGHRLCLVITGKGRGSDDIGPIPARTGVLRQQLPLWTSKPPLAGIVLQVTPAHRRHGGTGAFYVYLARRR